MKLIEAEKAKDVIHEYFKSLMAKDASGTDVYKLAVGIVSCLEHDANLLKAIDELPSAEPDTTTHDSIPAKTGKNDGDRTSGDCISRQPEQRWIPVSERLPRQGQEVICQCRANIIKVLKLDANGDWYQDAEHCYMSGFVVAWILLPELYQGGDGNETRINNRHQS